MTNIDNVHIPKSIEEALNTPKWRITMEQEIQAL